jgi:hypothetical protein
VLDDYANGIEEMVNMFGSSPGAWTTILQADLAMRSEEWNLIRYLYRSAPCPGFDEKHPWVKVIALSSFGVTENATRYHWWNTHVVYPMQSGGARAQTMVAAVEGLPDYAPRPASTSTRGTTRQKQHNEPRQNKSARGSAVCWNWNEGGCNGPSCPNGRTHACSECSGPHRLAQCPKANHGGGSSSGGKNSGKGKSGGKGKSSSGKKGSRGKGSK